MLTKKFLPFLIVGLFSIAFFLPAILLQPNQHAAKASMSGYTISGHISDEQGNGLYGVTIRVSSSLSMNTLFLPLVTKSGDLRSISLPERALLAIHKILDKDDQTETVLIAIYEYSVVSDQAGNFSVPDLAPGSYTLTPLGEYFVPVDREIIVPPDATSLDFLLSLEIPWDMKYVAEGEFWMGCDQDGFLGYNCLASELPLHAVYLDAYLIDQHEVTNVEYGECVYQGLCSPPLTESSVTRTIYFGNATYANYPVMYISWDDASAYCAWKCKRLPTEAEWEKAARGVSARTYPWGEEPGSCTLANGDLCIGDTSVVGDYSLGVSPYGLVDMAGNLSEWVYDWFTSSYYADSPYENPTGPETGVYKVYRGGNYYLGWTGLCTSRRPYCNPGIKTNVIGFRCVVSP